MTRRLMPGVETLCLLFGLAILVFSCNKGLDCPLEEIEWDYKKSNIANEDQVKIDADINAKIKAYLKKIGDAEVNAKISPAIDKLAKEYTVAEIRYDDDYVQNYNALVNDICTKLQIVNSKSLRREQILEIEKDLVVRLKTFYETTRKYQPTDSVNVTDDDTASEECKGIRNQVDKLATKLAERQKVTRDTDLLINIMYWKEKLQSISKYNCSFIMTDKAKIEDSIIKASQYTNKPKAK